MYAKRYKERRINDERNAKHNEFCSNSKENLAICRKKDKKTGNSLPIPEGGFDHWCDLARYALQFDMVDWDGNAPKKTREEIHQEKLQHQQDILDSLLKNNDNMLYSDIDD